MADTIKPLAEKILDILLDMDFIDYADTMDEDIKNLVDDLELLKKQGNGTLLTAIEMLTEN